MMTERNGSVSCCERYGMPFAAWDLRLYLDTHPNDGQAMAQFAQLCGGMEHGCYADRGIHLCDDTDGIWHWIDGPWPWEPEANCKIDAAACGKGGR